MEKRKSDVDQEFTDIGMLTSAQRRGFVKFIIAVMLIAIGTLFYWGKNLDNKWADRFDRKDQELQQTHRDYREIIIQMVNRKNITESKVDTAIQDLKTKSQQP